MPEVIDEYLRGLLRKKPAIPKTTIPQIEVPDEVPLGAGGAIAPAAPLAPPEQSVTAEDFELIKEPAGGTVPQITAIGDVERVSPYYIPRYKPLKEGPQILSSAEAAKLGLEVPEGQSLEVRTGEDGFAEFYLSPPQAEQSEERDIYGEWFKEAEAQMRKLYPDSFKPGYSYGFTEEQLPSEIVRLALNYLENDTQNFVSDLYARTTPEDAAYTLKLLGAAEDFVLATTDAKAQEAKAIQSIRAVFPEAKTVEDLEEIINTDFNGFIDRMRTGGRTKEKQDLLRLMGYEWDTINEIFSVQRVVVPIDGLQKLVTVTRDGRAFDDTGRWVGSYNTVRKEFTGQKPEGWIKDTFDAVRLGASEAMYRGRQFFAGTVPNLLYPEIGKGLGLVPEGVIDFLNETNKQQRDAWRKVYAANREEYENWQSKHPDLIAKPEFEEGPSKHPELLINPEYYLYEFASTAPLQIATMVATVGTFAATKNPLASMVAGMAIMTPVEAADAYEQALNMGAPEGKAAQVGMLSGLVAGLIESYSDLVLYKVFAPGISAMVKKQVTSAVAKATIGELAKRGATGFLKVEATEIAEEEATLLTNAAIQAAYGVYDKNRDLWQEMAQTAAKTFAATVPMGIFGGGTNIVGSNMMPNDTNQISGLSQSEIKELGLKQDPATKQWFRPMTNQEFVANLVKGGVIEIKDVGFKLKNAVNQILTEETGAITPGAEPGGESSELGQSIAKQLNLKFDGVQEGIGMQFTDPQTGSTTYGNTLEEVKDNLSKLRQGYETPIPTAAPGQPEAGLQPSVTPTPTETVTAPPVAAMPQIEAQGVVPPIPPAEPLVATAQYPPDMPASQEVANHIAFDPDKVGLREKFLRGKNKAMSQWIDKLYPIDKFVSAAKKLGVDISLEENPYIQARMLEGVTSKATSFLEDGTFGRKFWKMEKGKAVTNFKGDSFTKILESVKSPEAWRDFSTYLTAHRARELGDLGIQTGITPEVANNAIIELDAKYPNFSALSDKIQKYQSDLLDYVQESGLISPELRKTLDSKYMSYVPFYRVLEELQGKGYMGKKMVDIASPVKRIKGSESEIVNPLESIVKNTYAFISAADRNQIGVMMARLVNANPELQGLFEPIKTPMAKVANVTAKELGIDVTGLSDADAEGVFDIFRPSMFTKENVATVLIDGKKQFFKVDPDLNTALSAMDAANMGVLWKILSPPAKWLRAGATLSPDFAIRNPLRDALSAMIYSNYGFIPGVDTLKGLASVLKQDTNYELFKMSGAEHSMLVSLDREYLAKTFKEIVEGKKFTDYIKHPLQLLQIASEVGEKATRLGEFARGIKQGATPLEAGFNAREVTLDFAKAGTQAKAVNQIIAFFNSNIRGPEKMITSFKQHPIRTSLKILAFITLPSIALWSVNHDDPRWKEIPQWQKDLFWIVMVGDNIYRIPKPFEVGIVFGSGPERLLDYLDSKDSNAIKEWVSNLFESMNPLQLPTAIEPIIENITDHSFFRNAPIVPRSLEDLPPELQYTEYTSEVAKGMGKLLKQSPMKIDNIIQGWTGGLGRYATDAIDLILQKTGIVAPRIEPSPTLADLPVIRAFVVRNPLGGSSESVSKFYDELDTYTALEKSLKGFITDKNQTEFEKMKAQHPELLFAYDADADTYYSASARYLRQVSGELSAIRKLQDKVYKSGDMTPEKKRELIDSLDMVKTEMAKRALELLRNPSGEAGILEIPARDIEDKLGTTDGSPLNEDVVKLTDIAPDLTQASGDSPLKKLLGQNNKILADIANLPDTPLYQIDRNVTKSGLTRRQNELLDQYEAAADKKAFLEEYPELKEKPKTKWVTDNPESNAILALWGNSKLLTQKAYDIAQGLVTNGDIPDNTLSDRVLPPKEIAKPYFELSEATEAFGDNSWESKLILAKNPKLAEWLKREMPDTPVASLELKVKYRKQLDEMASYSDKNSPDYIADEKARQQAIEKLRTTKVDGDTEFRDVERRIDAIEKLAPSEDVIKSHIDYMLIVDEPERGSSSAEAMVYRVENPDYDKWRTDETVWGDSALKPIDQKQIPIWYITAQYRQQDAEYSAIKSDNEAEQARLRAKYMADHPDYRMDSRRREAYQLSNSLTGYEFPDTQVEKYVGYYELDNKGFRQERYLLDNPEFARAMKASGKLADLPKTNEVPAVQYDDIYDQYRQQFDLYDSYATIEDADERQAKRDGLMFMPDTTRNYSGVSIRNKELTEFGLANYRREAYGNFVSEQYVEDYVAFKKLQSEGKPKYWEDVTHTDKWYEDDWFIMEHQDFYRNVYLNPKNNGGKQLERWDLRKVPTRDVFKKYLEYVDLPHDKAKQDYRLKNPDLDAWGVIAFGWKPIEKQKKREGLTAGEKFAEEWAKRQQDIEDRLAALRG